MRILIGSRALEENLKKLGVDTKNVSTTGSDYDYFTNDLYANNSPEGFFQENFYDPRLEKWTWSCGREGVASLDELYTIKLSHSLWNLEHSSWEKHIRHLIVMKNHGATLIRELFDILYPIWEDRYGKKEVNLNQGGDDFFNNHIERIYEHDSVHDAVKFYDQPLFNEILKDGSDVLVDKEKFFALSVEKQHNLVFEEIFVIALERKGFSTQGKNYHKDYLFALKKLVTELSKGWFPLYILDNISDFSSPPFNYYNKAMNNRDLLIPLDNTNQNTYTTNKENTPESQKVENLPSVSSKESTMLNKKTVTSLIEKLEPEEAILSPSFTGIEGYEDPLNTVEDRKFRTLTTLIYHNEPVGDIDGKEVTATIHKEYAGENGGSEQTIYIEFSCDGESEIFSFPVRWTSWEGAYYTDSLAGIEHVEVVEKSVPTYLTIREYVKKGMIDRIVGDIVPSSRILEVVQALTRDAYSDAKRKNPLREDDDLLYEDEIIDNAVEKMRDLDGELSLPLVIEYEGKRFTIYCTGRFSFQDEVFDVVEVYDNVHSPYYLKWTVYNSLRRFEDRTYTLENMEQVFYSHHTVEEYIPKES